MSIGSTCGIRHTCFAGRSLSWMLTAVPATAQLGPAVAASTQPARRSASTSSNMPARDPAQIAQVTQSSMRTRAGSLAGMLDEVLAERRAG
jgi:hypothetical protein